MPLPRGKICVPDWKITSYVDGVGEAASVQHAEENQGNSDISGRIQPRRETIPCP